MMDTASRRYLLKRVALSIGLLALGAAMAWAISLTLLQNAAIAEGVFPQPGSPVVSGAAFRSGALWQAAKTLQQLANTAGLVGLVLLAGYGLADRYWPTIDDVDATVDAGMDEVDA